MKVILVAFLLLSLAACGATETGGASEPIPASETAQAPSEAPWEPPLKDPLTMPADFWQHAFDDAGEPEPLPGIVLYGSDEFQAQVRKALAFLGKCDAPALAFVQREVAFIVPGTPTGADPTNSGVSLADGQVFATGGYTEDSAVYWLAGTLAHEAEHMRQSDVHYAMSSETAAQRVVLEIDAIHVQATVLHECAGAVPVASQPQVKAILDYIDGILDGTVRCDTCDTPIDKVSW